MAGGGGGGKVLPVPGIGPHKFFFPRSNSIAQKKSEEL